MPENVTQTPEVTQPNAAERKMLFGLGENSSLYVKRDKKYVMTSATGGLLAPFVNEAKKLRADLEPRVENKRTSKHVPVTVSTRTKYVYVAMHKEKGARKMVKTSQLNDTDYAALSSEWKP